MIDSESVRAITEDVLITMLELPVEFTGRGDSSSLQDGYRATIEIHQAGQLGGVLLCSDPFARRVAAQMFMCSPQDVRDSEVSDAVGELINIIGGNVKGVIGGDGILTIPRVASTGSPAAVDAIIEESIVAEVTVECDGAPMRMIFHTLAALPHVSC